MTPLRHIHHFPTWCWIFLVSLLLIGYLVQDAAAQDVATADEPTLTFAEITLAPMETSSAISELTEFSATSNLLEVTLNATLAPTMPVPSETLSPSTLMPSAITSEAALAPSGTTQATTASTASILLVPNTVRLPENGYLSLMFVAQELANVQTVTIACAVDPVMLDGVEASSGNLFLANSALVNDSGFQFDGQWVLTATQSDSIALLDGSGVLWSLNYQVIASGFTQIVCKAQVFDHNGLPLPLAAPEMILTIEGYQDSVAVSPTQTEASPEITNVEPSTPVITTAEDSLIVEISQENTSPEATMQAMTEVSPIVEVSSTIWVIPAPPAPDTENFQAHLSGSIEGSQPLMQAVVTIIGFDWQQTVAIQDDGSFAIDIPSGSYEITFSAPRYLPYTLVGLLPAATLTLAPVKLVRVEIGEADVAFVIENFGLNVPPNNAADLNGDLVVNIYDLALVSASAQLGDGS